MQKQRNIFISNDDINVFLWTLIYGRHNRFIFRFKQKLNHWAGIELEVECFFWTVWCSVQFHSDFSSRSSFSLLLFLSLVGGCFQCWRWSGGLRRWLARRGRGIEPQFRQPEVGDKSMSVCVFKTKPKLTFKLCPSNFNRCVRLLACSLLEFASWTDCDRRDPGGNSEQVSLVEPAGLMEASWTFRLLTKLRSFGAVLWPF